MQQQQKPAPYWEKSEHRLKAGDVDEILAWVDYCIAKRLGPDIFERSIVNHLSHSCQRVFTFNQINAKVKEFWKVPPSSCRPNGEARSGHRVLYRIGTKALRGGVLSDERAQIIEARVQQLMKQPVPEYVNPSSRSARKKRKVEHISTGDVVAKSLFEQAKRSHLTSRADSIPGRSLRNSISVQIPLTPSRMIESARTRRNRRVQSPVPKCEHVAILRSPTISPISKVIEDSQSPSASWCKASPEVFLTPPREIVQLNRTRTAASPLIRSAEEYPSCSLSQCEIVRQLLSDCERDLQYLRGKMSEAVCTIEQLQTELASEEHRRAICESSAGAPTQVTLRNYLAEIKILQSQILNKEVFVPFTTRNKAKYMPFDKKYFEDNMLDIRNEIDDFMCCCSEISRPCNDIMLQSTPADLRALLNRVLGNFRGTLQAISFHSLLRSILSAAVCEWVLERKVQERLITGCQLRDAMLSHLTTMDGEDVARNLDLAAHRTLIESDYFQDELIPRRAEALAEYLSKIVEPLFGLQNLLGLWEVNILKEWQRQRPALKKIFVSALKIKTRALVSNDIFEVIFPAPGCEYDPQHTDFEERDNGRSALGQSHIVRLCLVPGLRKFAFDRKLVDYNSFRRPSTSSEESGENIASPLVIPE